MGEATGIKDEVNQDTFNVKSDKIKVIIIGSSRVMGLDAEYIDQIISENNKSAEVFNRGLSSDLPSRRFTVLDQSITDKPDMVLIGIDYANYLEKSEESVGISAESKFKGCATKLPSVQDTYTVFVMPDNAFGFDSKNFNNPKLSTLKLISKTLEQKKESGTTNQEINSLFEKSISSWNQGNLEEAINLNNKILEIDPNYYDAILNNGIFLLKSNKTEEASYFVNKAIGMSPDSIRANYNKQILLEKQGKTKEAQFFANRITDLEKQKLEVSDLPNDFEASKISLTSKQSWRFDEPSWRKIQNDQWISDNIKKRKDQIQYSMPFEPNGKEAKSLEKIIRVLKQDNIQVILFTTPIYKELYHTADLCQIKNFEGYLQKLGSNNGIPVYYLHDKYLELNIWRDQTHIVWGKTVYSKDIAEIISKEI